MPPGTNYIVAGEAGKTAQINALMDVTGYTLKLYVKGPQDANPRMLSCIQDPIVKNLVNRVLLATDFPVDGTYTVELIILNGSDPLKSLEDTWKIAPALA